MRNEQQSPNSWTQSERLALLWTAVFGVDGRNGLRGDMREQQEKMADFETIYKLLRWMILGLVALAGFLMSDTAAKIGIKIAPFLAP